MIVEFFGNLSLGVETPEKIEVGETPMKAIISVVLDKSDPLNQVHLYGFKYGNCGARLWLPCPDGREPTGQEIEAAFAKILQVVLDRAEDIRKGVA